jgi:hypothetical protein
MKAISLIIGVCIVIMLLGAVMASIQLFRAGSYTEPHNITTGAGETSSAVILTQELLDDSTSHVSVSSNLTGDAAVPSSYDPNTGTLTIGGLLEESSRQVSVAYSYNQLEVFWGADLASRTWPLMIGIGILGIIGGAVASSVRRDD